MMMLFGGHRGHMFFGKNYPIGIDISDYSIEVLQLNKQREILAYGRIILEEGIVDNGKILAKEKLAEKIKEVLESTVPHAIVPSAGTRAIVSLPESRVFLHYFEVEEDLHDQALSEKVLEEASKVIPVPTDHMQWDFVAVGSGFAPGSRKEEHAEQEKMSARKTILFISVAKEIVSDLREVFTLAGLQLVALDIESMSLGRALLALPETTSWLDALEDEGRAGASTMIIDIGARTTTMSIFDRNQILLMSATIPIAGERFTYAIQEKLGISRKEAEDLKRKFGFDGGKGESRVFSILQAEFQGILQEMKTVIQYYERKRGERIAKIILAGGSSLLPKIDEYISVNVEREVALGEPIQKIRDGNVFSEKISPLLFADVIGLALRGIASNPEEDGINLLPEGERGFIAKTKKGSFLVQENTGEQKKGSASLKIPSEKAIVHAFSFHSFAIPLAGFGIALAVVFGYFVLKPKTYDVQVSPLQEKAEKTEGEVASPESESELSTDTQLPSGGKENIIKKETVVVVILDTPTGWLRVRSGPGTTFVEVAKVNPGEKYEFLEESSGWYKIQFKGGKEGWVVGTYVKKELTSDN